MRCAAVRVCTDKPLGHSHPLPYSLTYDIGWKEAGNFIKATVYSVKISYDKRAHEYPKGRYSVSWYFNLGGSERCLVAKFFLELQQMQNGPIRVWNLLWFLKVARYRNCLVAKFSLDVQQTLD